MGLAIDIQPASAPRAETVEHGRRMLHADQVRPLYQKIPTTAAGSIFAALVLISALWDLIPSTPLLLWFAAICAFQLGRLLQYLRFRRAPPPLEEMRRAGLVYAAGAFFSGCLWGSAGLVLFIPDSIADQALVFMVLWGMATAGVTALASYAPAFYAFTLPALLPIILRTALEGGASHWFTAAVGLLFLAVTLVFGRNLNRLLTNCFCLTQEKADLVTELTAQKTAADLARQQAEVAHLIKSRLVEELTFEKAAAERARREAEAANRAKSQFLAAASHDLRQPLHALGLFAGALSERIRYPEVRNIVTNINASVEALEALFNEILDISKLDAGVVEPNLANFAIAEVLQRLRTGCEAEALQKGLKFRVRMCNAIVFSDAVLLERILRNLVGNAVRYTEKGAVLVACRRRGRKLRIEVRDSGIGIPPEQQERVFQEFYQLGNSERDRRRGLGLGLAIVRRLGRLLNCEITLNSRPGRGSVFAVQVPLGEEVSVTESSPGKTDQAQPGFSGRSVVVIDDEAGVRESMRVLLTQWGFAVCVAGSTEEALELSRQAPAPDAIIADYRLRGDALGIEAIQALQARFRSNIPAVLVTGDTAPDRLREATASGFRLLHKPVAPAKLRSLLMVMLEERANVPD